MGVVIVTGSGGLVGSEGVEFYCDSGSDVVGIDNDSRRQFFGEEASTAWRTRALAAAYPRSFRPEGIDIRDEAEVGRVFARHAKSVELVLHCAAQPSHDWAARDPVTDFSINATGTLVLLEATRKHCPDAVFVHLSTNKVYGDTPNRLPLVEQETRWEIDPSHPYRDGIPETLTIDQSLHSVFGASKVAGDVLAQEYGRYFGLNTVVLRGGCLTGENHAGAELHGFLAYLMKCVATGRPYTVYGYQGKQVRDNIHSRDLIRCFEECRKSPRPGEVYNVGGGRFSNCSMLEAIATCQEIAGRELRWTYEDRNRIGDHIWYISDMAKFHDHYPSWKPEYDVRRILVEMFEANAERWSRAATEA